MNSEVISSLIKSNVTDLLHAVQRNLRLHFAYSKLHKFQLKQNNLICFSFMHDFRCSPRQFITYSVTYVFILLNLHVNKPIEGEIPSVKQY